MKNKLLKTGCVSVAALFCISPNAIAGDTKFGVLFGGLVSNDVSLSSTSPTTLGGLPATFGYNINTGAKFGYLAGGTVSYWTDSGLIYEAEFAYQRTHNVLAGDISFSNNTQTDFLATVGAANVRALSAMANIWYEFGAKSDQRFRPYIGGGVGIANVKADGEFVAVGTALGFSINNTTNIASTNTKLAWQLGAGVNYHMPNDTIVSLGYRYIDKGNFGPGVSSGYDAHALIASIRF